MNKPKVTIVDKDDNIIGSRDRKSLAEGDIYRVSALWVTNSRGEILLARRHKNKSHHPRKWGPAVAGTVEENESYEENIIKETEEEIGVKNIKPAIGPKTKTIKDYPHFTQWYILNIDEDIEYFTIQEDEVEEIKWFSPEEFKNEIESHLEEFIPTMTKYFKLFSTK